ncbi:sigma-E processing peptidase SpoIIGA [Cohnella pontilimi]|uniref:Sigma-E processing peptidase SpoIIGA n=1 Tax=Cohnella pontilimi TaxID=2564100 RepID=A0A4U0FEJ4_9BACL|nr:sigma-E processing peptidase SpoIIGA [Cohnella pontilimi]TJY43366.1 sigma-E processing peptidase SpoIIGA [Cohnella pontilimi]
MIVFVDLVFFTNFALDATVLLATAKVRKLKPRKRRVAVAAAAGAAYAVAMFWADVPYLYSLGAKVFVSLLMVLLSFGYGGPLAFLRNFGAFYMVNFATLGGVIGLGSLLRSWNDSSGALTITENGGIILDWHMHLGLFAASFFLSLRLFHGTTDIRRKRNDTESLVWKAEVRIDGASWSVPALLDTGNRLYDPLTRTPVMILEASVWEGQLPAGWCTRLQTESADRLVAELDESASASFAWMDRLRLVPYRGVNGSTRMMLAVKPDALVLSREGHPPIEAARVLIGLDGGTLSSDRTYRAILHPELVSAGQEIPAPSQPA